MPAKNLFVNITTGVLVRVGPVDESYALISSLTGPGSRYNMPTKEYDSGAFTRAFRPATEDDLNAEDITDFRLPADAPAEWSPEPTEVPATTS
jgi:hypothetical protein